jgi:HlyD family secretion protein
MRLKLPRRMVVTAAIVIAVSLSSVQISRSRSQTARPIDALPCATVHRADVDVTILAQGEVQCAEKITVQCELESLGGGAQGAGSSTILYLAPEGSHVKEGDLLCELDASVYVDMLQQEEIKVNQARAEEKQAELDLEIAEIAEKEFREGINRQTEKGLLGQIALARSEVQRAGNRLEWTIRMLDKGYLAEAQVTTEKVTLQTATLNTELLEMSLENYRRFTLPKQLRGFQSQIAGARAALDYQQMRLEHELDRLDLYKRQVERCTIRAPHDGMAVYANEPGRPLRVYVEAQVRRRQSLFYLPDLSDMELVVYLHETVVSRVDNGMRARIRVEALAEQELTGEVKMVARLPMFDKGQLSSNEVKFYRCLVKLDSVPEGLLPGMTAQIVLETDERRAALVVPTEAVTLERGRQFCYVVRGDHLERQSVDVAAATSGLLEVKEGLNEGDRVVLNPVLQRLNGTAVASK